MGDRTPLLTLHLHGAARVVSADGRETLLERRAAALAALVALAPGFPREQAAAWLWPDSNDPRRNLRQQLLRFRQQFGAAFVTGSESLRLADEVQLAEGAADQPLLAGHPADGDDDFAGWLAARRAERTAALVAGARAKLAQAEGAGDLDAAAAAARELVAAEPEGEDAYRELMRVHYLRADPAAGLAVYGQLVRRLADRHGLRPSAATEALAQALRQGGSGAVAVPPARGVPPTLLRPPRLVGRERERVAVLAAWREGTAVLLTGEPGLGKSRLLAELGAAPELLATQGRPGDAGVPYATLARLLRRVLQAHALAPSPAHRAAIAALLPEWQQGPPDAHGARDPLVLRAAVAAVIAEAATRGTQALAVDDLHFADDASVELLHGVMADAALPPAAGDAPAAPRWLFAQRPGEAGAASVALQDGLAETGALTQVALAPLDGATMQELLASLALPGVDTAALAPALVRHTGGNPLFALETLKLGLADGSLLAGLLPRPLAVGSLIEHRLRRLGARALALARVAAVAGVDFDVELAERAIGVRAVELADAWAELEQAQVLRDEAFAHDLVCDAVLRTLPAPVSRRLHALTADWLAERGGEPARVAEHWLQAGEAARALAPLRVAAERAEAAMRNVEALALYDKARAVHEAAGDHAAEAEVLFRMSESLRALADPARTRQVHDRLLAVAQGDADRARAWLAHSRLANEMRQMGEAIAHGRQALDHALRCGDAELSGRSRIQLALVLAEAQQAEEARALLDAAREWTHAAGAAERCDHLEAVAYVSLQLEDYPAAVAAFEQQLREPLVTGDPLRLLQTHGNLAVAHAGMGAMRAALAADEQRRALAAQHEVSGVSQNYLELNAGTLLMAVGRYREALEFLERAEARAVPDQAMLHLRLATLMFHLGQHARALQHLERCEAAATVHPIIKLTAGILRAQVRAASTGAPRSDPSVLSQALELAQRDGRHAAWVRYELACAEFAPPREGLAHADAAAERAAGSHLYGLLLAARTLRLEHALELGEPGRVRDDVPTVLALRATYESHAMYRCRVVWAAVRVLQACGDEAAAARLAADEVAWVRRTAADHVPSAFRPSFLERNPVNAALLAAASRAPAALP